MNDEVVVPIGVYRSPVTQEIKIGFSDGTAEDITDCTLEDDAAARKAAGGSFPDGTDWFFKITDDHRKGSYDGMGRGDGDQGGDGRDQENNQSGDDGDGDDGTQGDGQESDDQGDGSDGDGEGDQQESDSDDDDQENDDMDFSKRRNQDQEEQPIDTDALANELWPHLLPAVRQVAHNYSEYAAEYAIASAPGNGKGDGSGLTLHFDSGKVGKVEGVTHKMFPKVLAAVQRGVNVYLPGPPGTGKSHMAEQIAEALGIPFNVDSFSPMSTEAKLLGFKNAQGEPVKTGFERVYADTGGVELFDEMDNANGSILAVMNGGLANGQLGFASGVRKRHENFVAIATANTLGTGPTAEFAGRQKIDPATLNRFVKIFIDTDEAMEDHIIRDMIGAETGDKWLRLVRQVRRAVADLRIKHFVTMRDSINGARLIAPGAGAFTQLEALEHTVLGVLTPDQVDKIKNWRG